MCLLHPYKQRLLYDDKGEVKSEEPEYEDGTGTVTFNDDGTFTWHEDQSVYGTDMVFEWVQVNEGWTDSAIRGMY